MRDTRGIFYYPFPQNKRVCMYVRKDRDTICFRLWDPDDPELWMSHGWVPYEAIAQASAMFDKKGFDPRKAYDLEVARSLLSEAD